MVYGFLEKFGNYGVCIILNKVGRYFLPPSRLAPGAHRRATAAFQPRFWD